VHPALFPFKLDLSVRDLIANPAIDVHRQGDQSDFDTAGELVVDEWNEA
jgi:hypothetical protein